ncbi:MAG: TIGR04372 family glycosyltransferase, partial [Chloroflexi bacterium]|nr:TIGR04372 family glycosyltransferase [Chloroflexota bacterium]
MPIVNETANRPYSAYWGKIPRFLARQTQQVRAGGWPVFARKISALLSLLIFLPVVLLIRLLRPFIIIRFGELFSTRIGHFAGNTEVYLCERDAGINVPHQRFVDVWYQMPFVCNTQLKKMWERTLHICPFNISLLDRLNRLLPGGKKHAIPMPHHDRDVHGLLAITPPHLSFTLDEEQMGRIGLKDLGIPEGTPFVCFHNRDSAYLQTISIFSTLDLSYHDYRDSNIHNYLPAVEELTRRGYYAIRMGAVVKEKLKFSNDRIIDYASDGERSAFMDIYLGAKCCFYFGNPDGLFCVPMIFRRPAAMIDAAPLDYIISWGADN